MYTEKKSSAQTFAQVFLNRTGDPNFNVYRTGKRKGLECLVLPAQMEGFEKEVLFVTMM